MELATSIEKRWMLSPVDDEERVRVLGAELNDLPAPLARALTVRGVHSFDQAERFFRDGLDQLYDPFLMKDMERAAGRVIQALNGGERVLVYGDYDVDGTTSTAMMVLFLRSLGLEPDYFVPNRFVHGYGLCRAGIDVAVERGASLIIALDCGITAVEEAAYAQDRGLDLVICDHHNPGERLPEATAILDPKRADCEYPYDGLSGCGVGFKLIQATLDKLGRPRKDAWPFLDLVAVSTASDIVPLRDENRILMREGLERLCEPDRPGLQALANKAAVDLKRCTTANIVFGLGPRINAAGRLSDASRAVDLLVADDPVEAARLADAIEELNVERRKIDKRTHAEAIALAEPFLGEGLMALVLHNEDWHAGVIGITASRVAEHFHRPAILLTRGDDGEAKGSARSIKGLSIHRALESCSDLLTRFGGHDFAAGLALPVGKIPALRERLQDAIAAFADEEVFEQRIELDAQLSLDALGGMEDRFWRVLCQFAPFGPGNPRPTFWGTDLEVRGAPSTVGTDKQHLKLQVRQRGSETSYSVIGFGLGSQVDCALRSTREGRPLEIAFSLEENYWNGRSSLQLKARDVRLQES